MFKLCVRRGNFLLAEGFKCRALGPEEMRAHDNARIEAASGLNLSIRIVHPHRIKMLKTCAALVSDALPVSSKSGEIDTANRGLNPPLLTNHREPCLPPPPQPLVRKQSMLSRQSTAVEVQAPVTSARTPAPPPKDAGVVGATKAKAAASHSSPHRHPPPVSTSQASLLPPAGPEDDVEMGGGSSSKRTRKAGKREANIDFIIDVDADDCDRDAKRPRLLGNTSEQTPYAQTPQAQTPQAQTPQAQTPQAQTPQAQTPQAQTPYAVGLGEEVEKSFQSLRSWREGDSEGFKQVLRAVVVQLFAENRRLTLEMQREKKLAGAELVSCVLCANRACVVLLPCKCLCMCVLCSKLFSPGTVHNKCPNCMTAIVEAFEVNLTRGSILDLSCIHDQ
jgi:hypothetical protein